MQRDSKGRFIRDSVAVEIEKENLAASRVTPEEIASLLEERDYPKWMHIFGCILRYLFVIALGSVFFIAADLIFPAPWNRLAIWVAAILWSLLYDSVVGEKK